MVPPKAEFARLALLSLYAPTELDTNAGDLSVGENIGSKMSCCQHEKSRKPLRKAIYSTHASGKDMSYDLPLFDPPETSPPISLLVS
jgi:hypothetical protein